MELSVREAAKLLNVPEKTVHRWIKENLIPAHQVNDQIRFNRAELLEWAASRKMSVAPEIFARPQGTDEPAPSLLNALAAGGIHYHVPGADKTAVLRAVVDVLKLPEDVDREFLFSVLLARESLGSTAIGEGIAIPHVRNPIVLHLGHPVVALCFLDHPIDFGAVDSKPVNTLFTLISPTVPAHLQLLSLLMYALQNAEFKAAVISQAAPQTILAALESHQQSHHAGGGS